VLEHVHLGHGPSVYHRRDLDHVHVVCDTCGAVGELEPADLRPLAATVRARTGFRLAHPHFGLEGRCPACVAAHGAPGRGDDR
jgi:Fur family ferric uptake transcriptional regulator